jgi:hypothetical protein
MWRRWICAFLLLSALACPRPAAAHTGKVWFTVKEDPDKRLTWLQPMFPARLGAQRIEGEPVSGPVRCEVSDQKFKAVVEGKEGTLTVTIVKCGKTTFRVIGLQFTEDK